MGMGIPKSIEGCKNKCINISKDVLFFFILFTVTSKLHQWLKNDKEFWGYFISYISQLKKNTLVQQEFNLFLCEISKNKSHLDNYLF